MSEAARHDESAFRPRAKLIFLVFALIGAFLLLAEHRAHIVSWLPWLFLAACPLMHLFMHHGHRRHDHHGDLDASGQGPSAESMSRPATHAGLPGGSGNVSSSTRGRS